MTNQKKSGFLESPPEIRVMPPYDGKFELLGTLTYDVGCEFSGDRITVPKGFITDFASVPRVVRNIYPPMGKYSLPAVIHDWLYVNQGRTRLEADKIFLEAMKVKGVNFFNRNAFYIAVRTGGWVGWRRNALLKKTL